MTSRLPRRVPHGYRIVEDADVITICTPSGIERFFRHAGWDLAQGDPPAGWTVDREALIAAGRGKGEFVLGPPLEPEDAMPAEFRAWNGRP